MDCKRGPTRCANTNRRASIVAKAFAPRNAWFDDPAINLSRCYRLLPLNSFNVTRTAAEIPLLLGKTRTFQAIRRSRAIARWGSLDRLPTWLLSSGRFTVTTFPANRLCTMSVATRIRWCDRPAEIEDGKGVLSMKGGLAARQQALISQKINLVAATRQPNG